MNESGSSLVDWVRRRFETPPRDVTPETGVAIELSATPVRVPLPAPGFRLRMGAQRLDIHADPLLAGATDPAKALLVIDPDAEGMARVAGVRIAAGEECRLHPDERRQRGLYRVPGEVRKHRPVLLHAGDALLLRVADTAEPASLTPMPADAGQALQAERRAALATLRAVYAPRFEPLPADEALATLEDVNELMTTANPWQPRDTRGEPGALLELPPTVAPILVGDIHGRIDNLLTLLTRRGLLAAVESGSAALVFLGDLVHHDDPAQLEQMRSSMLVMDLLLSLKRRHPRGVFMLLGNHDGFSPEVMKGGVPQGLLWKRALLAERGEAYCEALSRFYAISPMVLRAARCCACHAGPPMLAITRQSLVDAHCNAPLAHELAWTRCAGPGVTHGYRAADVRQLRRALGLPRNADLVVGHYPRSGGETVWMDSDHIDGHHVLFSARDQVVGVMPTIDGDLVPQVYPVERIVEMVASAEPDADGPA